MTAILTATTRFELELAGAGGEPVDLWRTARSHGLTSLPPMALDQRSRSLELTIRVPEARPRTVIVREGSPGRAHVAMVGPRASDRVAAAIHDELRRAFRLDADLTPFYARVASDPDLAWAARGAGRLLRSQTVFEEVVKTICTTNCAWSATERMLSALVSHLGERALGAPEGGARGRAFPTPAAMAEAGEGFVREVVRAGYRSRNLHQLALSVAEGSLDLEILGELPAGELPDDELERRLLRLPGVGPYAAAHVMLLLGRTSRLVLDSWTRPKYARLADLRSPTDAAIARRFRRFGPFAGLAFWLTVTRDWE